MLALQESELGKEHPFTLTNMNNLTLVLSSQGKYKEAESIRQQTLALYKSKLGKKHPDTLTSMNNLCIYFENSRPKCRSDFADTGMC